MRLWQRLWQEILRFWDCWSPDCTAYHRYAASLLLPLAALISSILLVVADMLARNLFSPLEIPAGILVSMIGIPYFIYLMMKLDRR